MTISKEINQWPLRPGDVSASGISTVRATVSFAIEIMSDNREVRTFDKDSALDPTIMSILKHNRETPSRAAADLLAIASSGSSTKADGGESGKRTVDPAQKKIQALEEELAGIKVTKNEVERKYQCERGMRRGAEGKVVWLQEELQKLQDLVAQLRELSTTQV